MGNQRRYIWLAVGLAALLGCSCMLFSRGAVQPAESEEAAPGLEATVAVELPGFEETLAAELPGFEETLAAEIEGEIEQEDPATPAPEAAPTADADPLPGAGWKAVEGLGGFFRLEAPEEWAEAGDEDYQELCAGEANDGCLSFDLRIKYASAERLLEDYLTGLQENVTGYQELGREPVTLDGLPGVRADVSYTWREAEERSFVIGLVFNRVGLLIAGFGAPEAYDRRSADFERALASFDWIEFPDAPPYAEWGVYEEQHLTFAFLPGTWIEGSIAGIAGDHEAAYAAVVDRLALGNPPLVQLVLYPSETALYRSTARTAGFAITGLNEVHAIWSAPDDHQSLGHELTHVISAHALGEPNEALLGEGLAVCLDQSGRDYRQVGQQLVENQAWISFDHLAGDLWFEQDPEVAYPQSGSAACYLLEQYGAEQFKAIYPQDLIGGLRTLGVTLTEFQEGWLAWARGD
jgi:hypothetical protein